MIRQCFFSMVAMFCVVGALAASTDLQGGERTVTAVLLVWAAQAVLVWHGGQKEAP